MIIGTVHGCDIPKATKELHDTFSVWECQVCAQRWRVLSRPESWKWFYWWEEYYGEVEPTPPVGKSE